MPRSDLRYFPERWHRAPRRWGHALHSLCSYMAMFPPAMPHVFTRWLTEPGDVVYDPFSGRGTTPLEASLLGRVGLGSDANPLACVLTGAKVDLPTRGGVARRLSQLRELSQIWSIAEEPDDIKMLFSRVTLGQLLWLRSELSPRRRTDRFILAMLLGVLHGGANSSGLPRGLTVAMPNTFAMSPGYVRNFIEEHGLVAPEVDVLDLLERRFAQLGLEGVVATRGHAWRQDAAKKPKWPRDTAHAKLVFTSPPYLEVIKYGKYNWIRLWLLGTNRHVVDDDLFASKSLRKYLAFMTRSLQQMRSVLRADGYVCLVIGDVRHGEKDLNLAREVRDVCVPETDLRVVGTIADRVPVQHKVSRIWKDNRGRATKTDRILVLAGPDAPPPGRLERINWEQAS